MKKEYHPALETFPWNEAELDFNDPQNRGLVSILAFDARGNPKLIGSGVTFRNLTNELGLGATASHVFEEVPKIQDPLPHVPDFLKDPLTLKIDPSGLKALYYGVDGPVMCDFEWIMSDKNSDIAYFGIKPQEGYKTNFEASMLIAHELPEEGDVVSIIGYDEAAGIKEIVDGNLQISLKRRLVVRVGRVTAHRPEGGLLSRGYCIETNIPVFSGMSGGLAAKFKAGEPLKVFGIVSSDSPGTREEKNDRSRAGCSQISILKTQVTRNEDETFDVQLIMPASSVLITDPATETEWKLR